MHNAYDKRTSEEIALLYLTYWGKEYTRNTGKIPSYEQYARIWNGGPKGLKKASTLDYWKKVHKLVIIEESKLKLAITKDDCHSLSDSHLIVPASSMLFDQSDLNSDNCLHRLEILCFPEYSKHCFSG